MSHFDRSSLQAQGFGGFVTFEQLWEMWLDLMSKGAGVYAVLREKDAAPTFLDRNPGGWFKDRDPTVPIEMLEAKWVEAAYPIYFGKADNLQRRLKEYARFGRGEKVAHWGGRYIWQLADSADLVVAWKKCEEDEFALTLESQLLEEFRVHYGALPFANIVGPG